MEDTLKEVSAGAENPWDPSLYPFEHVQPQLKGLVFGNLEGPLTCQPKLRYKPKWMQYYFRSPVNEAVAALKLGGFRVLSVANNHSMDCGPAGLRESLQALRGAGIVAVGAGENEAQARKSVLVKSAQGGQLRFLAACAVGPPGTFATRREAGAARLEREALLKSVREAAAFGDPVVVSLHWGVERRYDLPVEDPEAWQVSLAHELIDHGATLILGHHTHAVSRFEEYKHGLIAYSLGNFLFSGARMASRRRSVILRAELDAAGVHAWNLEPVRIDSPEHPFQPRPLPPKEARHFLKQVLPRPWPKFTPQL